MAQHTLFYRQSARCWDEALPIGNGRLGAMIFGRTGHELIELNEDTLWSGFPKQYDAENYFDNLCRARELLKEKKYLEADNFISDNMLPPGIDSAGYLTAGRVKLSFASQDNSNYLRKLNLQEAVHVTTSGKEESECFASHPHQVIAMRYKGTGFALTLDSPQEHTVEFDDGDLCLNGCCPEHARYGEIRQGNAGIRYQIRVRLLTALPDSIIRKENALCFSGGEAVLLIAIRTSFIDWKSMPVADDYAERCKADLDSAARLSFDDLKKAHVADHQSLYLRSELKLPESAEDALPTDERLKHCGKNFTPALAALLYHFGRYLLIASSRPDTQPANLQGIWNPYMLAPWASNYTTNINLEMNYWHAEGTNLSECAEPLLRFAKECAESGQRTAREYYHASGWCLHHNSDLWRYTAPASGRTCWGFWPVAGLWICRHIFEHYEYSGDRAFLREFYPVLRGAVEFQLDFLVRNEKGEWTTSPSTSPENGFIDPVSGEGVSACDNGTAMDLELTQEALEHFLEASTVLGVNNPLVRRAGEILAKLRPLKTGSEGQLLEYDADYGECDIAHRHLSHLYGAYPGELFTPERNPDLFKASEISLIRRKDHNTGWAMGWRLVLWARFRNAEKTKIMLKEFLTPIDPLAKNDFHGGGIYPNLFSAHPPFQIDANFGVTAGILEMLVQSHRKTPDGVMILELLPAIPDDWTKGSISGVRCRNGITLNFVWEGKKITKLELRAKTPMTVLLITPESTELQEV